MEQVKSQRFFGLSPVKRPEVTIDETENGQRVFAILRKLDIPGQNAAISLAKAKIGEYVPVASRYGDLVEGLEKMPGENPFPPVGGEWVTVSQESCISVAFIATMQVQDDPYSFEEIVAMSKVCPESFLKITAAVNDLGAAEEKKLGETSTITSSDAPSAEVSAVTP